VLIFPSSVPIKQYFFFKFSEINNNKNGNASHKQAPTELAMPPGHPEPPTHRFSGRGAKLCKKGL